MDIYNKRIEGLEVKFNNFEEKNNAQYKEFKEIEKQFLKLKEEYSQLVTIVLENKEQIKLLLERLNDIIKNNKEVNDDLLKKIDQLKKYADDKILELNTKLELILNNIGGGGKNIDLSSLDEFMKKLINLENQFEEFVNKVNVEEIYKKLKYLGEHKANKEDLENVQEIVKNLNKKSQEHQEEIETIKYRLDSLYQEFVNIADTPLVYENNNKINNRNKIEDKIDDKKKNDKETKNQDNKDYKEYIDLALTKYILKEDFEIYKNDNNMEIKKLWDEIKNINNSLEELSKLIKEKLDMENLNELRDFLLGKIDELINDLSEKFADKNDYNKNIKYLEEQIKKLFSLLNTRKEVFSFHNADNWLLAKKPINSFSCAACESFIGDLKGEKNSFVPWNKLPVRDPGEKIYRMGNGFSKILNMIKFDNNGNACLIQNVDSNNSNETDSDNESNDKYNTNINENQQNKQKRNKNKTLLKKRFQSVSTSLVKDGKDNNVKLGKTQSNFFKKEEIRNKYLPKLKKEMSAEALDRANDNNQDKPKITKIFRKTHSKFHIKSNN